MTWPERIFGYFRSPIAAVLATIYTLLCCLFVILSAFFIKRPRHYSNIQRHWARTVNWILGVKVKIEGAENFPAGGCLYVFNHTSTLDITVLYDALPGDPRFGAKVELFSIPAFGAALKRVGLLPIVRHQRDQVLKLYTDSIARVNKGESFILAPEGTRFRGPDLGPFKAGPFIFAINGQFSIVPVVIIGANRAMSRRALLANWGRWSSEVIVKVLPPVNTQGLTLEDRLPLQEEIRDLMRQAHPEVEVPNSSRL